MTEFSDHDKRTEDQITLHREKLIGRIMSLLKTANERELGIVLAFIHSLTRK